MKYSPKQSQKHPIAQKTPYATRIRNQAITVDSYNAPFWDQVANDCWEPHTFDILSLFLQPSWSYCDLGAWIGPTVLHAAARCRRVVCAEPDPVAHQRLLYNLHQNNAHNVTSFKIALSDHTGHQQLGSFRRELGDSMTSFLAQDTTRPGTQVRTMTWKKFGSICDDDFDFIKIDIEGAEFKLLPTMQEYLARQKPVLYLSLHPHLLPAEAREQSVLAVFSSLKIYRHCLSTDLTPVTIQDLCFNTPKAYRGPFVFTDSYP